MELITERQNLGKFCTASELEEVLSLQKAILKANAAALPANLPQDISDVQLQKFLTKTLAHKNKIILKRKNWWKKMVKKYQLPVQAAIDTKTGEFFRMRIFYNVQSK